MLVKRSKKFFINFMFFYLSKVFSLLFFPYPLFLLILLVYFIIKKNKAFIFLIILFCLISTEFIASKLTQILEDQFPVISLEQAESVDAVIVLSGLSNPLSQVSNFPEFSNSVERILIGEKLYLLKKTPYIILSGATGYIRQSIKAESISLKQYLLYSVPEEAILVDDISRNTYENALESLKICKAYSFKKVYLITSAFHMYRAFHVFQHVLKHSYSDYSLTILPYPVDYNSFRTIAGIEDFFPSIGALGKSTTAIKEFIGILAYYIKGYLSF